ncbi:hypothetical protein BKA56DRAFT_667038 [Ilyonectria sp. MPI-CAGE-AT-0026]|nr:hypothetical protein BKA56DRAFT_667038 [Ilyonectria sp. MPI-CAGE-AT-0026]
MAANDVPPNSGSAEKIQPNEQPSTRAERDKKDIGEADPSNVDRNAAETFPRRFNGKFYSALQAMHSGIITGKRNADNIDKRLEAFQTLLLANENITVGPSQIKAFTVTSFGFGQKGAQVIVVHPRYLYAAISKPEYSAYRTK